MVGWGMHVPHCRNEDEGYGDVEGLANPVKVHLHLQSLFDIPLVLLLVRAFVTVSVFGVHRVAGHCLFEGRGFYLSGKRNLARKIAIAMTC